MGLVTEGNRSFTSNNHQVLELVFPIESAWNKNPRK